MRIAYVRPDGGVSIVHAAPREDIERSAGEFESHEAYAAHVIQRSIPADATNVVHLPDDMVLPGRDEFRNAWRMTNNKIAPDMTLCRTIWRDKLRVERQPVLDALDRDYNRAIGKKQVAEADQIEAKRQALRDLPAHPGIEAAKTPGELRAISLDARQEA